MKYVLVAFVLMPLIWFSMTNQTMMHQDKATLVAAVDSDLPLHCYTKALVEWVYESKPVPPRYAWKLVSTAPIWTV